VQRKEQRAQSEEQGAKRVRKAMRSLVDREEVAGAVEKKAKKEKNALIEVNRDFCKGCGICVAFCPKGVLELDDHEKVVAKHPEKCNACMLCELRCPDMAIEVKTG
jgi:2-oxoglutarate ferredoxin oxidoreductase subunit delta